jgi:hypothetical protein
MPGCTLGGSSSTSLQNDELRRKVAAQESTITALTGERDELKAKLGAMSKGSGHDAAAMEAAPVVTTLEIDRLSALEPMDPKSPATSVRVYVATLDGRARFTQAVGHLSVVVFDAEGKKQMTATQLAPLALREAYRSGVTGTHYEVVLPLTAPLARDGTPVSFTVEAAFDDAMTGHHTNAKRVITR